MKIMVDSVPQNVSECIFSDYGECYMRCKLDDTVCNLEHNMKCDKLIGLNGISVTVPNQIKLGK